jgi:hypothetical protein
MRYLSNLYKATFKKIRGKAYKGWIRPTIGEFFMTHKDFTEVTSDPLLTYPGSTHRESEVIALGGEVFDTGNGTIGKVPLSSVPSGWSQAENWQRYSRSSWGGDPCGNHDSTASTTWGNNLAILRYPSSYNGRKYWTCSYTYRMYWLESAGPQVDVYSVGTSQNPENYRVEIGIY